MLSAEETYFNNVEEFKEKVEDLQLNIKLTEIIEAMINLGDKIGLSEDDTKDLIESEYLGELR